jgi:hypothetical protein
MALSSTPPAAPCVAPAPQSEDTGNNAVNSDGAFVSLMQPTQLIRLTVPATRTTRP